MAQKRRRQFTREFKLEAVRLVLERGVSFAQASRDLGVHVNVLRKHPAKAVLRRGVRFGQG